MKKVMTLIILIIIGVFTFFFFKDTSILKKDQLTDLLNDVEEEFLIDSYSIFGTHLNMHACIDKDLETSELVLKNKDEEIILDSNIENEDGKTCIYISKLNNDGIYLDDLKRGNYLLLIKSEDKYYTFKNDTEYSNLEYYTITKDNKNNKIEIIFDSLDNKNYLEFKINRSKLPNNVYDIAIDPGHGGMDSGSLSTLDGKEYHEADFTLAIALILKDDLEDIGLKVKLTRDSDTYISKYENGGRAVIPNEFNTKYSISLHLNSSAVKQTYGGVEVYIPNDVDTTFASLLADKLSLVVGYSKNSSSKISNGVYFRYFTKEDIKIANKDFLENDMKPYDIKEGSPYMFMIREVGGINTYAYIDGRNDYYGLNPYYNSNKTAEPYLIEMAYINYDLKKIINNEEKFSEAIKNAIKEYLNIS